MIFLTKNLLLYSYFPVIKEYEDRYWFHNKSHKQNLFLKFFEILPLMMLKWKSLSIITDFYKSILTIMLTRQFFFNDVRIANNYSKIQCILAGHSCISSQYTIFVVSFRDILIFKPMALNVIFLCCLLSNLRTEHFIEGSPHIRMNLLIKTNGHRCCSVL